MLNSRLGHFTAASIDPHRVWVARRPFSRSYGAGLPSSLTRVLPIALVFSTRLPVSDCGTVTFDLARHFSCQLGSPESQQMPLSFASRRWMGRRICLSSPPTGLDAYSQNALELPCWVMPLLSPGFRAPLRTSLRPLNHGLLPPGDTLRCKRSPVVPEYQPDVHRLRLTSSA